MKKKLRKNIFIFLTILFLFLSLPKATQALFDPLEFLDHLTESIEDIAQPIVYQFIRAIIFYIVTIFLFGISTILLQTSINSQTPWLNALFKESSMVEAGFHFTSGLANTFLILVFIFIAFAYILKLETFEAKKALPRLIIVALLLNFSLLFVKMLVDLSQIFYNTFKDENLFWNTMGLFLGNAVSAAITLLTIILAPLIAAWAVPFLHPFAQIAFVSLFTTFYLPQIVAMFFQIFLFLSLSSIFGIFAFLFFSRVFVIAILAILAPLAFVSSILPQTRKWWSEWLKHLTEWLVLGIFFLFFLTLGIKSLGVLSPEIKIPVVGKTEVPTPLPLISWFQLAQYIFYYMAIFVYFTILLWIGKKYVPTLADTLITQAKAMSGFIWTRGIKPFGMAIKAQMRSAWAEHLVEEPKARERWERWATTPGRGARAFLRGAHFRRAIGRALGPAIIERERKTIDEYEKKFTGQTVASQLAAYRSATRDTERLGILQAIIKDKNIDAALEATRPGHLTQVEIQQLFETAQRYDKMRVIRSAFPGLARATIPPGTIPPPPPGLTPQQQTQWRLRQEAEYIFDRIRPSDYENMSRTVLQDDPFLEALLRRGRGEHVRAFIRKFEREGLAALERRLHDLAAAQGVSSSEWLKNNNPHLYRYFTRGAGRGLITI